LPKRSAPLEPRLYHFSEPSDSTDHSAITEGVKSAVSRDLPDGIGVASTLSGPSPSPTTGICLTRDKLLSAEDVADLLPPGRQGRRMHRSTFYRWCTKGRNGNVLESLCIRGQRFTSLPALLAFLRRLTESKSSEIARVPSHTSRRLSSRQSWSSLGDENRYQRVEAALKKYRL
jgi:hypothetical protein